MSTTIDLRETRPASHQTRVEVSRQTLRAMRPHQWIKNTLVAGAPVAAGSLFSGRVLGHLTLAFVAMSAAASAAYLINDLGDIARDQAHPTKRRRPIASGRISSRTAWVMAVVLALAALALGLLGGRTTGAVIAAYLALTISYSRWLKHVPFVELGVIAAGFMLRVAAGAASTSTPLSITFLTVVIAGSTFLAAGKRLSELIQLGEAAARHRPVLGRYRRRQLERLVTLSIVVLLGGYSAWALGADSTAGHFPWLVVSVIPVTAAVGRVALLVFRGEAGDPTAVVLHDRVLHIAGIVASLAVLVSLYVV